MRSSRLLAPIGASWLAVTAVSVHAGDWEDRPPLPVARQEVGVTALGDDIWVLGGILESREATDRVSRYDTTTDTWHEASPLPSGALHHVGAAAADGLVWALGGLDGAFRATRHVHALDPVSGQWRGRTDLPWARGACGVAVLDHLIWVAGGQDGGTTFSDCAVYDPRVDEWTVVAPMPTARNHLAAVALGGRIWTLGGRRSALSSAVEILDPLTGRWSDGPPLATARAGIAAVVLSGRIHVFGGEGNRARADGVFPHHEVLDPASQEWARLADMPRPRHGIGAAIVAGGIHIPGGSPVAGFGVTAVHDVYTEDGQPSFRRGDSNGDAAVDLSDAVHVLQALFSAATPLDCADASDADDDGTIAITDAVRIASWLFLGAPQPPAPGPFAPGVDPTADALDCARTELRNG